MADEKKPKPYFINVADTSLGKDGSIVEVEVEVDEFMTHLYGHGTPPPANN